LVATDVADEDIASGGRDRDTVGALKLAGVRSETTERKQKGAGRVEDLDSGIRSIRDKEPLSLIGRDANGVLELTRGEA
jgi:hypothetical protein